MMRALLRLLRHFQASWPGWRHFYQRFTGNTMTAKPPQRARQIGIFVAGILGANPRVCALFQHR